MARRVRRARGRCWQERGVLALPNRECFRAASLASARLSVWSVTRAPAGGCALPAIRKRCRVLLPAVLLALSACQSTEDGPPSVTNTWSTAPLTRADEALPPPDRSYLHAATPTTAALTR